jgi:hypothetical protein
MNDQNATCLYRHYDAENILLYVGISNNYLSRSIQHARDSKWWNNIASSRVEKFKSRSLAMEAERQAIIQEKPRYNIIHTRCSTRNKRKEPKDNLEITKPLDEKTDYYKWLFVKIIEWSDLLGDLNDIDDFGRVKLDCSRFEISDLMEISLRVSFHAKQKIAWMFSLFKE